MKPGPLILPTIWRGCDWQDVIFKWKDGNGDPFNLHLWIPVVQTRTGVSLNPTITDATGGVTKLWLPRLTTADMRLGEEQWDWIWAYAGSPQTVYPPILSGKLLIAQSETRTVPIEEIT